ncbi:hypothetical protein HYPSUDRAFT_784666 [Hypholoma sublateritium FD-334 SS-4]|uniref:F-box domain-containing protein n=1 Tax=Hypholoma sublateritium (strain FD-334 SS-4) TaxID=945553 RepID=A0A0D2L1D0_HYPSF|nr:hypothetical protein HYPSUDRAFT_784666 [Hypholoma sublateritium FD-334 SS-4]
MAPTLDKEPLSLTRICSWWRAVARAVPELWTAVSGGQDWTARTTPGVLRVWLAHLATAGGPAGGPVDLYLAHARPTPPDPREAAHLTRVLRLFLDRAHLPCLRALCLRLESGMLIELRTLLRTAKGGSPAAQLEEADLTFALNTGSRAAEINVLIGWLSTLPRLRRLRWVYLPSARSYEGIHINALPWGALKEVLVRFPMSLATGLACIARCTAATTIALEVLGWADDEDGPDPGPTPVMLPAVASLTLVGTDAAADHLLAHLTLPALRHLAVRTLPGARPAPRTAALGALLARSQCPLEALVLRAPTAPAPAPCALFALPGIARLRVLDVVYNGYHECVRVFLAGGGGAGLAARGVPRVMVWVEGAPAWEEHVGWTDVLPAGAVLSEIYECVDRGD